MAEVVEREAANVVTSNNAAEFYANKLGLANPEPEVVAEIVSEPIEEVDQSEPEAEDEAKVEKPDKQKEKLNKRFDKVTQRAKEAEARAVDLENRLRELEAKSNPQAEEIPKAEGKPQANQFNDAFEYAEALAEWSAENALKQRDAQEAERKVTEQRQKVLNDWSEKVTKAKAELPDFDDVVQSSKVVVGDEIRDSILESDVGAQLLYHLASNDDFAKELTEMPVRKALRELGKLEARFEQEEKPKKVEKVREATRSSAPSPISPLKGGKAGADVLVDTEGEFHGTYAQWKASRLAGKIR